MAVLRRCDALRQNSSHSNLQHSPFVTVSVQARKSWLRIPSSTPFIDSADAPGPRESNVIDTWLGRSLALFEINHWEKELYLRILDGRGTPRETHIVCIATSHSGTDYSHLRLR